MIFARSKMCALKSYHYVKIINTNNSLAYPHRIFYIHLVLSLQFNYCVKFDYFQQRQSYWINTDVLAGLPTGFLGNENVSTKNLPLNEITRASMISTKHSLLMFNLSTPAFSTNLQLLWKLISCLRCCAVDEEASCCHVGLLLLVHTQHTLLFWLLPENYYANYCLENLRHW